MNKNCKIALLLGFLTASEVMASAPEVDQKTIQSVMQDASVKVKEVDQKNSGYYERYCSWHKEYQEAREKLVQVDFDIDTIETEEKALQSNGPRFTPPASEAEKKAAVEPTTHLTTLKQQKATLEKFIMLHEMPNEFLVDFVKMNATPAVYNHSKEPLDSFQALFKKRLNGRLSDNVIAKLHDLIRDKYKASCEVEMKSEMAQTYKQGWAEMLNTIETLVEETFIQRFFMGLERSIKVAGSANLEAHGDSVYYADRILGCTFANYKREKRKLERLATLISGKAQKANDDYEVPSVSHLVSTRLISLMHHGAITRRNVWKDYRETIKNAFTANTEKRKKHKKKMKKLTPAL